MLSGRSDSIPLGQLSIAFLQLKFIHPGAFVSVFSPISHTLKYGISLSFLVKNTGYNQSF